MMILHLPPNIEQRRRLIKDKGGAPFIIRLYHNNDYPSLAEMYRCFEPKEWSQGLPSQSEYKREEWMRYMVGEGVNIIAVMEEKVVGHGALFEMERGQTCEYLVFVHQDYQDRGIGTALTQMMRELAQEMGYSKIWLTVGALNLKAIHVYEKVGFCVLGPRDIECVMVLTLKDDNEGQ
jgi:RimJ/RimL family protein N-acetyltransferase